MQGFDSMMVFIKMIPLNIKDFLLQIILVGKLMRSTLSSGKLFQQQ
jgi:hypothetical protein